MRLCNLVGAGLLLSATAVPQLLAQGVEPHCSPTCPAPAPTVLAPCNYPFNISDPVDRQVNITGATLFRAFFDAPNSTFDYIDVDCDGCITTFPPDSACGQQHLSQVDNLAPGSATNPNLYWIVQYRGVGSLGGFNELLDYGLCCDLPEVRPTELSFINGLLYHGFDPNGQSICASTPFGAECTTDVDGDGIPAATCSPICPRSMDMATVDVLASWAVVNGEQSAALWSRKPLTQGYGRNPKLSYAIKEPNAINPGPLQNELVFPERDCDGDGTVETFANFNFGNPDQHTLYDTPVTFVAVAILANRGVGYQSFTYSDLQYGFVTGRTKNGENLAFATRDAESGTRNACMNSLGIDPSQGVGDNVGGRTASSSRTNLGPWHRVTNCGSSSHMENGVQMRRNAVGYSGLSGSSAAACDVANGLYEIVGVIKDIAPYNATQAVRPDVRTTLLNGDPNTGYTIGGTSVFTTFGDPFQLDPNAPEYMANQDAANYLRNIDCSIRDYATNPDPNTQSPGQFLAVSFFLLGSLDAPQDSFDPTLFDPDAPGYVVNVTLQNDILANNRLDCSLLTNSGNGLVVPAYGAVNVAGKVPNRNGNGANLGNYVYVNAPGDPNALGNIAAGGNLSCKNAVTGDFDQNGVRDANDICEMLSALANPNAWMAARVSTGNPACNGGMSVDVPIPDVIGDYDGNGLFDIDDLRYFADGHALVNGTLNRKVGFTMIDTCNGGASFNLFGTTIDPTDAPCSLTPAYEAGDARFDVAGNQVRPGADPTGFDGVIDNNDFCYIFSNFGDWSSSLDVAAGMDLSADMNGDLVVDDADLNEFIQGAWNGTCYGDLACEGAVGQGSLGILLSNFNQTGKKYKDGDLDCDGAVGQSDLGILLGRFGQPCP